MGLNGQPVLRVRNLHVSATGVNSRVPLLRGVEFSVPAGRIVALVGESGAGKSLLALTIVRLLPAGMRVDAGEVQLATAPGNTVDILTLSERHMCRMRGGALGLVFQEPAGALNPTMHVGAQIAEAAVLHRRTTRPEARRLAVDLLGQMGFPDPEASARRYAHQLSGGMQQRAMLAMALAGRPALLIADEPTSSLDPVVQAQILSLLRHLRDELGLAILLITHDWAVVAETADEVCVIDEGRVIESGPVQEVVLTPRATATRKLLEAAQSLRAGGRHG